MLEPRSRLWRASVVLLAGYLGHFLTFLPGLHNHGPCLHCKGHALDPSRVGEHRTVHAGGHECCGCPEEAAHSPRAPAVVAGHVSRHDAGHCLACRFLKNARLFVVVPPVTLEAARFREILSSVPEAPDRLQSPYRRLPRGPPSA